MGYAYGYGFGHTWKLRKKRAPAAPAVVGGAALLVGEANGFATDFTYATDASRVALKTSGSTVAYAVDAFYANAGTSPKMVYDVAGVLGWSPHNLILQSENFAVTWSIGSGTPVVTAHTIADDDAGTVESINQTVFGLVIGTTYTVSAWFLKDAVTTRVPAMYIEGLTAFVVQLNTSTGAKHNITTALPGSSVVEDTGTHWKLSVTVVSDWTSLVVRFYPAHSTALGAIAANAAVGTITVDKVLFNRDTTPTAYLPTTTAARYGLALDYDPVTHASKGLLCEPAATNLLVDSNGLGSGWDTGAGLTKAKNASGPLGANTAWTLTMVAGTGTKWIFFNGPASGNYRYSVYAKAGTLNWIAIGDGTASPTQGAFFNVSAGTVGTVAGRFSAATIEPAGNGWFRCSATVTASVAYFDVQPHSADNEVAYWTATGGETVFVSAPQAETGTVATSYIPTTNIATVTRAEDLYKITAASINYSATAGSWWVDATPVSLIGYRIIGFETGTASPAITWSPGTIGLYDSGFLNKTPTTLNAAHKISAAYAAGDRAFTLDGAAVGTDAGSTAGLLAPGNIGFGSTPNNPTSTGHFYIRQTRYVQRRKANAEMVTETT